MLSLTFNVVTLTLTLPTGFHLFNGSRIESDSFMRCVGRVSTRVRSGGWDLRQATTLDLRDFDSGLHLGFHDQRRIHCSRDVLSGIHNARCVEHPHDLPTRVGIMSFHLYSILAGAQHHHPYRAHNTQIPRLGPGKTSACFCLLRETKRRKRFTLQCI